MPFKFHALRRHHIPRAKYRVMNWPDYDRGLVRRGDIRFWIDESALGETAMARVKRLNGGKLNARTFQSQQTEIAMQIDALNRSIRAAKPNTIRIR